MDMTRKRVMPRILRNRARYFGGSNERKDMTIESVVRRIQNTFRDKSGENNRNAILADEIPKSVNPKTLRNISRKRKQEICLEHLHKCDLDWIMYVPKNLLEIRNEKYERAENANTFRENSKDLEIFSTSHVLWTDPSLDFWNVDMDDWTNVQEVVDVESETIENRDNDDRKSSIIPLLSRSTSSEFCSIDDSKWIDVEEVDDDKLEQISIIDFDNDNDSRLDTSKDPGTCWNKKKKCNVRRVHQTLNQENRKLGLVIQRNCYCCRICDKKYRYKFSLHRHLKRAHGYDNEAVLRSPIFNSSNRCLKNYPRLENFINPANIHTKKDKIASDTTLRF